MVGRDTAPGPSEPTEPVRAAVGVHLMPLAGAVDTPRPSVVATLDADGHVTASAAAATIDEIVDAIPQGPSVVAVDAPLQTPPAHGRRAIDELVAWLDVPVLPMSAPRMTALFGGVRGVALAERLAAARPDAIVLETFPDLALRLMAWIDLAVAGADLRTFRERWLGLRPAPYRPKGAGRARPAGLPPAAALVARHVDTGGWTTGAAGDWGAIADAATLDALACAWAAMRLARGAALVVDAADDAALIPADDALAERVAVNVERLAADGLPVRIRIPLVPGTGPASS